MKRYLRKATLQDKKLIYNWANDPDTRKNSFNQETIKWEDHEAWYDKRMADDNTKMYIFMDFFKAIGQVRLDVEDDAATISYSVDKDCRGQGIGKEILYSLEKELVSKSDTKKQNIKKLIAHVKADNIGSKKVFESLGYEEIESEDANEITFVKTVGDEVKAVNKKSREANLEILRVIAMLMVIVLHYLYKGGLLHDPSSDMSSANMLFWLVECFALSCVNVYVLISGYYMVESRFTFTRLFKTWFQVFFYSAGIAIFSVVSGMIPLDNITNAYELLFLCCPVFMGHYWFASAYMLLLILAPILSAAARSLTKKQFQIALICLLSAFCFAKTVFPFVIVGDDQGNGIIWFICLFMVAAYIRLHGADLYKGKLKAALMYIFSSIGAWIYLVVAGLFVAKLGRFEHLWQQVTDFNFVFVFFASVGLFMFFRQMEVKENFVSKILVRMAPYTFGVYLLHEHIHFAHRWIEWLKVPESYGYFRPVHLICTVLVIFVVGIVVDYFRSLIYTAFELLCNFGLKIYYAKKEVWDYLIFGFLATVVNWVAYFASRSLLPMLLTADETVMVLINNTVAWIAAVIFAYWTNRCFVFKSETKGLGSVFKEFVAFVSARILSFLVEQAMMFVLLSLMHMNDIVAKLIISVVVIILNYIFSKLFVFKNKNKSK